MNAVDSLLTYTSIKRKRRSDGHVLEVPTEFNRKYYIFVFYKTTHLLLRTADTFSLFQVHKTPFKVSTTMTAIA